MLSAALISIAICAAGPAADPLAVPPWPADLPAPIVTECGTLLPPLLADEVHLRLELLDRMPGLCRHMLTTQAAASDEAWAAVLEVKSPPSGWPTWAVVGAGGLGLVGGVLLGVWVGG